MEAKTSSSFNGGQPQQPKKKNKFWLWLILGFLGICIVGAILGESVEKESGDTETPKISKEEWAKYVLEELNEKSEYTDSVLARARGTKSSEMLAGYVSDMEYIANKTISDSLYMDVYNQPEISNLMESNSVKAKKILPELKKIVRVEYAKQLKEQLWEENIDVKTSNDCTVITFIGAVFANNKNIKHWEEEIESGLQKMGFKQVRYKWIEHTDKYTYYDLQN